MCNVHGNERYNVWRNVAAKRRSEIVMIVTEAYACATEANETPNSFFVAAVWRPPTSMTNKSNINMCK